MIINRLFFYYALLFGSFSYPLNVPRPSTLLFIQKKLSTLEKAYSIPPNVITTIASTTFCLFLSYGLIKIIKKLNTIRLTTRSSEAIIKQAEQKVLETSQNFDTIINFVSSIQNPAIDTEQKEIAKKLLDEFIINNYEPAHPFNACYYHLKHMKQLLYQQKKIIKRHLKLLRQKLHIIHANTTQCINAQNFDKTIKRLTALITTVQAYQTLLYIAQLHIQANIDYQYEITQ